MFINRKCAKGINIIIDLNEVPEERKWYVFKLLFTFKYFLLHIIFKLYNFIVNIRFFFLYEISILKSEKYT